MLSLSKTYQKHGHLTCKETHLKYLSKGILAEKVTTLMHKE